MCLGHGGAGCSPIHGSKLGSLSHPPSASFEFMLNSLLTFPVFSSTILCGKGAGGGGQSSKETDELLVRGEDLWEMSLTIAEAA